MLTRSNARAMTTTTEAVSSRPMAGRRRRSGDSTGLVSCTMARDSGLRKSARAHCNRSRNRKHSCARLRSDQVQQCGHVAVIPSVSIPVGRIIRDARPALRAPRRGATAPPPPRPVYRSLRSRVLQGGRGGATRMVTAARCAARQAAIHHGTGAAQLHGQHFCRGPLQPGRCGSGQVLGQQEKMAGRSPTAR